ncbi:bcl-2-like protein 15 [Anas acuta]|uniref:bcl-2-like protein 15 n=1 Tax=Anas acuta TaxID=28680 RepID=UPI0035C8940B
MTTFEEQTKHVVNALYYDLLHDDEIDNRCLQTDSGGPVPFAGELPSDFDPVIIASRLRQIGDQCNMDFERVSSQALAEVLTGKMEKFEAAVDSLSRSWSDQNPEMVYERAFLSVSVKLMMHILKKVPSMFHPSQLITVINGNAQVKNYIEAHGGWENLDD